MTPQPKDPAQYTDPELIEAVATEVMGWQKKVESPNWWCWTSDGKNMVARGVPEVEGTDPAWNPLEDWNRTMEVWQSLIDRKLAPGIDQTDDHATVVIGRLDSLGCLEIFVQVEHANAQRAICIAALRTVRSAK